MLIQTENTPNSDALKFVITNSDFMINDSLFMEDIEESKEKSGLAYELFQLRGVEAVYISSNFITVTKENHVDWNDLTDKVIKTVTDYLSNGFPVLNSDIKQSDDIAASQSDNLNIAKEIQEIIETRVRPAVAMDGGDIKFHSFKEGVVYVELRGACNGCPSSSITLKNGIERMLQHFVPEVKEVSPI